MARLRFCWIPKRRSDRFSFPLWHFYLDTIQLQAHDALNELG